MHAVALPAAAQVRPLPRYAHARVAKMGELPRYALARVAKMGEPFIHPISAPALPVNGCAVALFGDGR